MKKPKFLNTVYEYLHTYKTEHPLIIYYGEEGSDFARFVLENNLFDIYGAPTFDDEEDDYYDGCYCDEPDDEDC